MNNADIIAKNLLENKLCIGCKFFYPDFKKCKSYDSIILTSTIDVEVFINGMLKEQNDSYVIARKKLTMLQHQFDSVIKTGTNNGYNIPSSSGLDIKNHDKVIVKERYIKDGELIKITHNISADKNIPNEQTCENFLEKNHDICRKV